MKIYKYFFLFLIVAGLIIGYFLYPKITIAPTKESIKTSRFSLTKAPLKSLKGQIIGHSGEIKYQSRTATESAKLVNFNHPVQQGEDYFTGEEATLTLLFNDHCRLQMQENTELKIIQTLKKTTVFSQLNGQIQYQTLGEDPISVRTAYLLTELNGIGLITRDSENSLATVKIESGQATLAYNDLNYQSYTLILEAGDSYVFNYDTRQGDRE